MVLGRFIKDRIFSDFWSKECRDFPALLNILCFDIVIIDRSESRLGQGRGRSSSLEM